MKKILNIGPCFTKGNIKSGGIVVLFEEWLSYCECMSSNSQTVDSNKKNYRIKFFAPLSIIYKSAKKMKMCDHVMLHGTLNDYQWIAPVIVLLAKIYRKQISLRKFAGNFWQYYDNLKGLKKKLVDYALYNADILFWETHEQVEYFSKIIPKKSYWFTNVRKRMPLVRPENRPFQRKFIYLSRIERMKGVENLKKAFEILGNGYTLDFYGPLIDYKPEDLSGKNYNYIGAIPSAQVNKVLTEYDVLILPTQWKTEGYPGIVMECFNAGIPVIASRIGGIPELIEDGKNGYLIDPDSTEDIINSVKKLDFVDYISLSKYAYESFAKYDADIVNERIMDILNA